MYGTIVRVRVDRGFMFIHGDGEKVDTFAHVHDLDQSLVFEEALRERRVQFEVEQTPKGLRARNVRPAV